MLIPQPYTRNDVLVDSTSLFVVRREVEFLSYFKRSNDMEYDCTEYDFYMYSLKPSIY